MATRYLPIARVVRCVIGEEGTVLDVGAGGLGISAYLRNPCVLTDYSLPFRRGSRFLLADAGRLPFTDRTFDAVVQADVMEHLDSTVRLGVTRELFRVSRKLVVVAAPAGREAEAHDRRLAAIVNPRNHLRHFLQEHFQFGLPTEEELVELVLAAASESFRRPRIEVRKNANLRLRYWMMRGIVRAENEDVDTHLRLWTPFSRLLAALRFGRCYRRIVVCREAEER